LIDECIYVCQECEDQSDPSDITMMQQQADTEVCIYSRYCIYYVIM